MKGKYGIITIVASIVLVGVGVMLYFDRKRGGGLLGKKSLVPEEADPELSKKFNFHLIPDGKNNYRSAQFTMDVYPSIIKKYGIKHIVRMNGDGGDSKHQSNFPETRRSEEEKMCKDLGCTYTFVNAHEGYKDGSGYVGSYNKIAPVLKKGNTLIHCTHGADRTGGVVASYLQRNGYQKDKDKLWQYTTNFNSWNSYIKRGKFFGSGYDKYADAFYPINELKNSKWAKQ
jgi:hypothetical protein